MVDLLLMNAEISEPPYATTHWEGKTTDFSFFFLQQRALASLATPNRSAQEVSCKALNLQMVTVQLNPPGLKVFDPAFSTIFTTADAFLWYFVVLSRDAASQWLSGCLKRLAGRESRKVWAFLCPLFQRVILVSTRCFEQYTRIQVSRWRSW